MNRPKFAPTTFAVAYACAYVLVLAMHLPLFLYYPLNGQFVWGREEIGGVGPSMAWYGLMASAAIIGVLAALIVSDGLLNKVLRNYLWPLPVAAIVGCTYLMRHFFM